MKVSEDTVLFTDAVNVMNEAIQQNRDRFPYKQIISATQGVADGMRSGIAVYSDDPDTPHDYYTLGFSDSQIEILSHGKDEPTVTWKVSRAYLKKVTENPEEYKKHPAKLDWDWLLSRLGIAGS